MGHKHKAQGEAGDADDGPGTSNKQSPPKRARSTSPYSERPDVNDMITEDVEGFLPKTCSDDAEKAFILSYIVQTLSTNSQWRDDLNLEFKEMSYCENAISKEAKLGNIVSDCFKTSDWKPLFKDPSWFNILFMGGHLYLHDRTSDLQYFKAAFEKQYRAQEPKILLQTIDLYGMHQAFYNRSFPIVQSSGMGKSHLMDHSATLRLTIPFNIHQEVKSGKHYPPSDGKVRDFLTKGFNNEMEAVKRPLAFLQALFTETLAELQDHPEMYKKGKSKDLALDWYKLIHQGSTADHVGVERSKFYER
ncbi:hypothetical protein E1B28_011012 [Marasmius oreades]|uniref:Uncharacterized protein n=1 Tax=Marasmius oreades TaxID=181124 RepID=A0A9P7RTQ9_9AGAR|nr:uncharacterized protein E1B28_011012 [Marasmius oreades]KAG7089317.1 hypothetical protein E1B28_011012 [Marasmius oreades]